MNNCYRFNKLHLNGNPIFKSIDATYIIHLEGNGRINHIIDQLSKITPSKIVFIVFNKGYKKCKKKDFINKSSLDLVDSYITIFKHANKTKYENILILEDDFIFENISENDSNEIDNFLIKNKNKNICYLIGTLPFILLPTLDQNHWIGFFTGGTHSVIYTQKYRNNILKINQQKIKDWDRKDFFKLNKYIYKKSLCFQTFPLTENRKNWNESDIMNYITDIYIKMLSLDIKIHPGYDIMYVFSKLILLILLLIFILVIIKLRNQK